MLGCCGNPEERQVVRRLLSNPEPGVRFRAAQGLLAAGDKVAVPVLIDLLRDASIGLADKAEILLRLIAEQAALSVSQEDAPQGTRYHRWRGWWQTTGSRLSLPKADPDAILVGGMFRARRVANRFLIALDCGDAAAVKQLTASPFGMLALWPHGGALLFTSPEMADFVRDYSFIPQFLELARPIKVGRVVESHRLQTALRDHIEGFEPVTPGSKILFGTVQSNPLPGDDARFGYIAVRIRGTETRAIALVFGPKWGFERLFKGKN